MLEKIININPSQPYKGKKKSSGNFDKFLNGKRHNIEKSMGKDSISFSPGALYLARINWQLKDITYPTDEKLTLEFIIEEFDFVTEVDFMNFYASSIQKFKVSNKHLDKWNKNKILIEIGVHKGQIMLDDKFDHVKLDSLRELFKTISYSTSDFKDTNEYGSFLYNIKDNLALEFQLINNYLYTFIDKLGKYNLVNEYIFESNGPDIITIEKIISVNA